MNHIQANDLTAGYVLGALEPGERQELLSHIESCVPCLLLIEENLDVGAWLATSITEAEAPTSLRIRILETLAKQPDHRLRPVARIRYRFGAGLGWTSAGAATQWRTLKWTGR